MEVKRGRGRPEKEVKASARVEIRIEPDTKKMWQQKAEESGYKSVAAWLLNLAKAA